MNDLQHMTFHGAQLVEVRCRICNATTMKQVGRSSVLVPTPAYAELVMAMQMPNGLLARHETGLCRTCRDRILVDGPKLGELESIFASDIRYMMKCAMKAGYKRERVLAMAERFASWKPIRALAESGRGER